MMNEESKKAGNAENENPLASSSGTTIRSFSHCPARSAGGALGCCFPTFLIYKSGVRHGRPGQRFILYFPWTTIACGPAGRGDFFPKHRAKSPVLCAGGLSGREATAWTDIPFNPTRPGQSEVRSECRLLRGCHALLNRAPQGSANGAKGDSPGQARDERRPGSNPPRPSSNGAKADWRLAFACRNRPKDVLPTRDRVSVPGSTLESYVET